ncbi:hypothetical protein C0995_002213 [Termitomyces sp. Mi166|nr:hypothetical protein C0995_002213 [Termitomyces sp. Mi166\
MSAEDASHEAPPVDEAPPQPPTEPASMASKKRPRLDLDSVLGTGGRERKRGKSMFGLVIGTLNKAKIEDKERNASEAAKKRQLIEQRLQNKLKKETDSVRRAEEAKKDKMAANRKEEELQLKDSIYKFRRTRLPLYANFLLTSDIIPSDEDPSTPPTQNPLANPPRTHPPPLYYLPAVLLPSQEAFLARRKREVSRYVLSLSPSHAHGSRLTMSFQVAEASEKEYHLFGEERARGITDINELRRRVADEEARKRNEGSAVAPTANNEDAEDKMEMDTDSAAAHPPAPAPLPASTVNETQEHEHEHEGEAAMDVDKGKEQEKVKGADADAEEHKAPEPEPEKKEEPLQLQGDEDDAVEY